MLFITFPSRFNIINTLPAALQLRLVTCHLSPGLWWRARAALRLARGWSPRRLRAHLSLPNPMAARQLSFGQCYAFFPVGMTILWLMSNSYCSCPSLLLPPLTPVFLLAPYWGPCLVYGFLLFIVFSTPSCLLFLLPLCSLCCLYTLCSAVPHSHSIALFHVPNDCSSLLEKCLLKTHCPYIREWNKDELAWLGEPGKCACSSDESSLSWALIFRNSWTRSAAVMMAF